MKRFPDTIRPTRSGVYLVLFGTSLFFSSLFTNTNLLLLMDLFLMSLLIFNFLYLRYLRLDSLVLPFPAWHEEGRNLVLSSPVMQSGLPFSGRVQIQWRFNDSLVEQSGVLICHADQKVFLSGLENRGEYRLEKVTLDISYPLHLMRKRVEWGSSDALLICPKPEFHDLNVLGQHFCLGKDEEIMQILRLYVPGDELRSISWKAVARTGELYVRPSEEGLSKEEQRLALHYTRDSERAVMQTVAWLIEEAKRSGVQLQIHARNLVLEDVMDELQTIRFLALADGLDAVDV